VKAWHRSRRKLPQRLRWRKNATRVSDSWLSAWLAVSLRGAAAVAVVEYRMAEEENGAKAPATKSARSERLAAALRANLRRRKAQVRGRATGGESPAEQPEAADATDASRNPKG
jgi:hypothetical protein